MINSRHTGMIIWIIKTLRRLHDTFYKQNALSLAFRQRNRIRDKIKRACKQDLIPLTRVCFVEYSERNPLIWQMAYSSGELFNRS